MNKIYDVVIVGSGPAGIFCALEISKNSDAKIVILEKGQFRDFNSKEKTTGFGGAGTFSDGKLNLNGEVGGDLMNKIGKEAFDAMMDYVDTFYRKHVANSNLFVPDENFIKEYGKKCLGVGLKYMPFTIRHLGTDGCYQFVQWVKAQFDNNKNISLNLDAELMYLGKNSDGLYTIETTRHQVFKAKSVVIAVGRSGIHTLKPILEKMNVEFMKAGVDIGVRVEVPSQIMNFITDKVHEFKLLSKTRCFGDFVRTFCMCPNGFVEIEKYRWLNEQSIDTQIFTVNGHSYTNRKSENTNFAILVHQDLTEPCGDQLNYARMEAERANFLSGNVVLLQSLGDLRKRRRSTPDRIKQLNKFIIPTLKEAEPGDLSIALSHRIFENIQEMISVMAKIIPGIDQDFTLLYGNEVKFYCNKPRANDNFEILPNIYMIGDGSGWTRGIMQASMHGCLTARNIIARKGG